MIAQGTDGLSRGVLNQGDLASGAIRIYAPINLTSLERSHYLEAWLRTWLPTGVLFLTPAQWFVEGHDLRFTGVTTPRRLEISKGCYLWTPPPCMADVAIEQLRSAHLKRHNSIHIMIMPKLFLASWRRQFFKVMDLVLCLPPRWDFWNSSMHEPLMFGFCFPFCRCKPWSFRLTSKLLELERTVQSL